MLSTFLALTLAASPALPAKATPSAAADVSEKDLRHWKSLLECETSSVTRYCQAVDAFGAGSTPRVADLAVAGSVLSVKLPPDTPVYWEEVAGLVFNPGGAVAIGVVRPENPTEIQQAFDLLQLLARGAAVPPDEPLSSLVRSLKGREGVGSPSRVVGRSLTFPVPPSGRPDLGEPLSGGPGVAYLRQTPSGLIAIVSFPNFIRIGLFRP